MQRDQTGVSSYANTVVKHEKTSVPMATLASARADKLPSPSRDCSRRPGVGRTHQRGGLPNHFGTFSPAGSSRAGSSSSGLGQVLVQPLLLLPEHVQQRGPR